MNKYEKKILNRIDETVKDQNMINEIKGTFINNYEIKTTGKYLKISKYLGSRTNFSIKLTEYLISEGLPFKLDYNDAEVSFKVELKPLRDYPDLEYEIIQIIVDEIE